MKTCTLILFMTLCGHFSFAQSDSVIRYWIGSSPTNIPSKAKTRAVYRLQNGKWQMESRYLSNGLIYQKASYLDSGFNKLDGNFEQYNESGQLAVRSSYVKGLEEGLRLAWNKNGVKKDSFFMHEGHKTGKGYSWNENGSVVSFYDLDKDGNGPVKFFRDKDSLYSQGLYKTGKAEGKWIFYAPEGYKEWEVDYQHDSVVLSACFDKSGQPGSNCIFEKEASVIGGVKVWKDYLVKAIGAYNYPSRKTMKSKATLSGEVRVRFMVMKDGTIGEVEILQSLNPEADEIALKVLQGAPHWEPGIYRGKPVRSYHTQPLTFYVVIEN
jgi:TonB family protein